METLICATYGMGTNSTAYIATKVLRRERIDLIVAADTGGERPETYTYANMFSHWLVLNGYPPVVFVKKEGKFRETLEENCLRLDMLPSKAYGYKGCSWKYKIEPQEKYLNNHEGARRVWKAGGKVIKLIGYDMDEPHRAAIPEDNKYVYQYPLLEWGWGRKECVDAIRAAGLPQPGKSSCWFCPSMTKPEILELRRSHPDLLQRALFMESNAKNKGNLKTINGLGRRLNWGDFIAEVARAEAEQRAVNMRAGGEPDEQCGSCYDGTNDIDDTEYEKEIAERGGYTFKVAA